jgi:hypothetical protein
MTMTPPLLDDRLRALAESLADAEPPASVDRAIVAAIATQRKRRSRAIRWPAADRWFAWPVALAASILALSFVVRQSPPAEAIPSPSEAQLARGAQTFMPIASADAIEQATDAFVMPARLPRTALAQLGLPLNPERVGEAVDTELLVRGDGAVLAVRFVR